MKPIALAMAAALAAGAASAAEPEVAAEPLMSTQATSSGQPIVLPQGPVQVSVSTVTIPPGAALPMHKHPYPRYGYVQEGRLRVINIDTGAEAEFGPGDFVVEALDQWHTGLALGLWPVKLLVIDQAPPGKANVVQRAQQAPSAPPAAE